MTAIDSERPTRTAREPRRRDNRVFLLRLWREDGGATAHRWRCSLEDPATRERRGFADVAALASFLLGFDSPNGGGEET